MHEGFECFLAKFPKPLLESDHVADSLLQRSSFNGHCRSTGFLPASRLAFADLPGHDPGLTTTGLVVGSGDVVLVSDTAVHLGWVGDVGADESCFMGALGGEGGLQVAIRGAQRCPGRGAQWRL